MTNTQAASPVALKVFAVTELLEAILLKLPEADLLLAQRVSKNFQSTILGSQDIQRKLFFRCDTNTTEGSDMIPVINPLLKKMYPRGGWYYIHCDEKENEDVICSRADCEFWLDHTQDPMDDQMCVHLPLVEPPKGESSQAQRYESASWRRMWATRPAVRVHLTGDSFEDHAPNEFEAATMGVLMDHILDDDNWYVATGRGLTESEESDDEGMLLDYYAGRR